MRTLGLFVLVGVCLLAAAGCVPVATPTRDPAAPVKAWVDAMNKGDVDSALALLADDATLLGGAMPRAKGKNVVGLSLDYLAGLKTKLNLGDCQPQADRVVCGLSRVDDCIAAFGATDGLTGKLEFIYRPDGKVRQASLILDDSRSPEYDRWHGACRL